ncbi:MAG: 1-deoxy-D-xylulose-5-phosphate reductoisomerase [Actinobacteria bacterium]|nr:1-deoxy-D-xylulose-5-phosphate reductoisomerase [Actinomycetota bacterium]
MNDHAPRRVAVLGSTGSIGRQALEVIKANRDVLSVVALVAGTDEDTLTSQARAFGVTRFGLGSGAAEEIAQLDDVDVVLNAVVGAAGLRASIAALEAGKVLALANKESLVAGGEICTQAAARGGGSIVPVDSEHAALFQCLSVQGSPVVSLVLTASGGPFRTRGDVANVTVEEALAHPTWSMGPKITVDSATLMNKGLEVIEAHHLFGFAYDDIDVVVHPQSVVHAAVRCADGTMVMQAAPPDMRLPIQAALTWPFPAAGVTSTIDLAEIGQLTFEPVEGSRFPSLALAYEAGRVGGSMPAVLNAANEEAVKAFLAERIGFADIPRIVADVMEAHDVTDVPSLEAVESADRVARQQTRRIIEQRVGVTS